jgi:HK97 family phage portal protein
MALIEFRSVVQQLSDLGDSFVNFVQSNSGSSVNRKSAMQVAAVYACVNAIANDISGLPLQVKQKLLGGGAKKIIDGSLFKRLKISPNNEMRPFIWKRTRLFHVLLQGNSYCFIEETKADPTSNLWLLDPDQVTVERLKLNNSNRGRLQYRVEDGYKTKIYKPAQILHLKGFSWNGLVGESVITKYAREQIGIGLELDRFEANFFKNGLNPGGIFKHPRSFHEKTRKSFIAAMKKRFGGSKKSRSPMILEDGMDFVPYEVKMVDQQFMELLRLNKADICGIFNVPQSRISISDSNTNYNNTEQEKRRYYESGLKPWAVQDEEEMNYKLLTEQERKAVLFIKYNFDAFLRGDSKTRAEISEKWWRMGVPLNRLLELEDRNPVEGGDVGRVQLNTMSLVEIDEIQKKEAREWPIIEKRSKNDNNMIVRDRIKAKFEPMFKNVAQILLDHETKGLKIELKKLSKDRSVKSFDKILEDFYKDFESYADKKTYPVFREFAEQIHDAICDDIGLDKDILPETSRKINEYIENFIRDYKSSSIGQLKAEFKDGLEAVEQRIDEWNNGRIEDESMTRPEKLADRHVNSLDGRVVRSVIFAAGLRAVWKNRGGKSCPYCKQLHNKVVGRGQTFLKSGDSLEGEAGEVLKTRGSVKYPQLHQGCHCYISWI